MLHQLLDVVHLMDGQGCTVDFRNPLIIMTSNLGSELWLGGKAGVVTRDVITRVLQAHFRPEFLNRIEEIISFHSLSHADLVHVVDIQLRHVTGLLAERSYRLDISPEARAYLTAAGLGLDKTVYAKIFPVR